ncbi:MAG: hypothetical protein KAJ31_04785 [Deltaproteobacteria bacterium]|nr:hypothetical protein [Deltaproteobacteria bacterium]MCK5709921.1 hypothetical protein [Deltaproteobacteria bacterium]
MTSPMGTPAYNPLEKPLTVGDWIITLIILSIPLVGLIFLLYWALSSTSNVNRKNFCIAYIVIALIFIAIFAALLFMGVLAGMMNNLTPA